MQLEIEIKTQDKALMRDIMGMKKGGEVAEEIDIPGNARLRRRVRVRKMAGAEMTLTAIGFLLEFGRDVAAIVVGAWLYEKIRGGRASAIIIEKTEVEFNEGDIKRVLIERIEMALKNEGQKAKE